MKYSAHARRQDAGFSLIELMVVVMVIGVLVGVAMPTLLGARERASARAAQVSLRIAGKAAWVDVVRDGLFEDSRGALEDLEAIEPSLTFVGGNRKSTDPTTVSVSEDADGQELALAVQGTAGGCYYLRLSLATEESQHHDDSAKSCRARDYADGPNSGW